MPRLRRILFAIVDSDIWTNPKIFDATPDGVLVFIFALTQNAKHGRTGRFPASDFAARLVAHLVFRDTNDERAKRAIESATKARLVDVRADEVFICGWDEEWQRDELNAQQALVRARYRTQKQNKTEKQKQNKRGQDAVTTTADVVMTTEKRSRRKPETAIGDWKPSDLTPELESEFQRFKNHALAHDRRLRCWPSAFRNWLSSPFRQSAKAAPGYAQARNDHDDEEHPRNFGT